MYDPFRIPEYKFPEHFIWGSAVAAHQVEGNSSHAKWWEDQLAAEGRLDAPSGRACNHYELYKEDILLLKELGHQAFRFSVEWGRIEPEEGRFDFEALKHYKDVACCLKEAGIQVFLTLHHGIHPYWFEKRGGFHKLENLPWFEKYVNLVAAELHPYVDNWHVINEFNQGLWEGRTEFKLSSLRYHARGYHIIKQYSGAPVSSAHAFTHFHPYRRHDPVDRMMTQYVDYVNNEFFFHAIRTGEVIFPFQDAAYEPEIKGTADYWAVNTYTREMVDGRKRMPNTGKRFEHKTLKMIPMDFYLEEMYPEGVIANLERLKDKPVIITENGCCCDDDRFRIVYLALHLWAMKEAMDRGVDLQGYLYWSLMDNWEWGSFKPRFGLVDVNFETYKRTPKPSAYFYRDIIRENGISGDILRKYLSEIPTLA